MVIYIYVKECFERFFFIFIGIQCFSVVCTYYSNVILYGIVTLYNVFIENNIFISNDLYEVTNLYIFIYYVSSIVSGFVFIVLNIYLFLVINIERKILISYVKCIIYYFLWLIFVFSSILYLLDSLFQALYYMSLNLQNNMYTIILELSISHFFVDIIYLFVKLLIVSTIIYLLLIFFFMYRRGCIYEISRQYLYSYLLIYINFIMFLEDIWLKICLFFILFVLLEIILLLLVLIRYIGSIKSDSKG